MTDEPTEPAGFDPCAGSWHDGELREGCIDCQRYNSGRPTGPLTVWVSPPLIITFECHLRIPPERAHG